MADNLDEQVHAAWELLTPPLPDSPVVLTDVLTRAHRHLSAALDEAMARAALDGVSVRAIAASAQVAPNSVPPRLARSTSLGSYAQAGKVSAEGIAVARADRRPQDEPFTFIRRRRT